MSRTTLKRMESKDKKGTLLRLISYLGDSKIMLGFVIISSLVATGASLYGSYSISPLINIIEQGAKGTLERGEMFSQLSLRLAILGVIFATQIIAVLFSSRAMVKISQSTVRMLRKDMYDNMLKMKVKQHDVNTHGDLMSRFTNDIDLVSESLNNSATNIVNNVLTLIGTIVVMLLISPTLSLITIVILPLLSWMASIIVKKSRIYTRRQQHSLGELNAFVEEAMEGQKVMQLFNHEEKAIEDFTEINGQFRGNLQKAQMVSISMFPLMRNANTLSYAVIGIVGGYLAINFGLSIGDLAAYVNMTRTQGKPINQISNEFTTLQSALASAERIFELIDWQQETIEEDDVLLDKVRGDVKVNHVDFSYVKGEPVLKDLTFYAKPGQKIAIVGSTGAGKTTITNLISRFYEIDGGEILVDDIDIRNINRLNLRNHIAMVLQDTNLFTGTIMENIRYGNLEASDEECIQAAKLANAHYFIRHLEDGYETVINGSGNDLSEGQQQLLNIARAAVANPSILILDEATSSIDTRTEQLVEEGMDSIMEGRTTFVIAHRLSTVRNADAIIVLEDGEIIEKGSHDDLLELNGRYASLYHGQAKLS